MNDAEREQLYRDAMRRRREGEVCPLCGTQHSALSSCAHPDVVPELIRPARELARTEDVETSHEAAAANPAGKRTNRRVALDLHRQHPEGLIDDAVSQLSGGQLDVHEATRRCLDLRKLKNPGPLLEWLIQDGEPVFRKTRSGRNARVSVLTPLGRSVANGGSDEQGG